MGWSVSLILRVLWYMYLLERHYRDIRPTFLLGPDSTWPHMTRVTNTK